LKRNKIEKGLMKTNKNENENEKEYLYENIWILSYFDFARLPASSSLL